MPALLVKGNEGEPVKNDGRNSKAVSMGSKSKAITTCYGNTLLIWPLKFHKWCHIAVTIRRRKLIIH